MKTVHFDGDGITNECPLDNLTFECNGCPFNRGVKGFEVQCDCPDYPVKEIEQGLLTLDCLATIIDEKPDKSLDNEQQVC